MPQHSVLGKKYYGAGQVVAASLKNQSLISFIGVRPEPFVYLGSFFAAFVLFLLGHGYMAATIGAGALVFAVLRGGAKAPVTYLSWLPQILLGITRYQQQYRPTIARQWSRGTGWKSTLH